LHEPPRFARTAADGAFSFEDLLPGEVTVGTTLGDFARKAEVMVYAGQTSTTDIMLTQMGTLSGRVESAKGARQQWTVFVSGETRGEQRRTRTDDAGAFSLKLPVGEYQLYPLDAHTGRFTPIFATVRANEETKVFLPIDDEAIPEDAGYEAHLNLFSEVGTGASFENGPGGVRVSFLMQGCPVAKAGVMIGDLLLSVDGEPLRDSLDAFAKLRRPSGTEVRVTVRRDGVDRELSLR
jgi:hypothetical protein